MILTVFASIVLLLLPFLFGIFKKWSINEIIDFYIVLPEMIHESLNLFIGIIIFWTITNIEGIRDAIIWSFIFEKSNIVEGSVLYFFINGILFIIGWIGVILGLNKLFKQYHKKITKIIKRKSKKKSKKKARKSH